jgi:DNA/RNA-binding domain of Phe-tRNA-synthetase-like protein
VADRGFEVEVDPAVHAAHPDYVALVVVASGLANGPSDAGSDAQLAAAEAHLRASNLERATDHPHVAAWRAAFSAFGAKPSRYPSSAEALISRVLKGQPLPRVNALVDLYNAVSVRWAIPVGGEDIDRVVGPVRLVFASGGESFDGGDPPKPGEVVWADEAGVTCRRWNWRQGTRTRLEPETTRAYFLFDALPVFGDEELSGAMDELAALLRAASPGAVIETRIVS